MDNTKALAVISAAEKNKALAYIDKSIGETVQMYKPDVTILPVTPADFHNIQGKLSPRKELVDRIGLASGIDYIAANCGVTTEIREDDEYGRRTIYIGRAQGRVRLPDGSWRESTVEEYEFDPVLRAKKDGKPKQDYMLAGRQRASTGARVRVVKQLTGMPTAFESKMIGEGRDLVFGRVVQNVDKILETPEGRSMALAQAIGVAGSLYGAAAARPALAAPAQAPERQVGPEPEAGAEPADDFGLAAADASAEPSELEKLTQAFVEWAQSENVIVKPRAQKVLDAGITDLRVLRAALEIIKYLGNGGTVGVNTSTWTLDNKLNDPDELETVVGKIRNLAAPARSA